VAGGTLPAAIWRQFMVEAHKNLPVRDFDWLPPLDTPSPGDPGPPAKDAPDPRNNFYNDLANDFASAAESGN
jgi:penicillin-binding protein 1A